MANIELSNETREDYARGVAVRAGLSDQRVERVVEMALRQGYGLTGIEAAVGRAVFDQRLDEQGRDLTEALGAPDQITTEAQWPIKDGHCWPNPDGSPGGVMIYRVKVSTTRYVNPSNDDEREPWIQVEAFVHTLKNDGGLAANRNPRWISLPQGMAAGLLGKAFTV